MKFEPPPGLVAALGDRLTATWRYRCEGGDHLRAAIAASPTRSVVFCLWHQSLFQLIGRHHGQRIAALTSLSRDGTIIARYLERIGLRPIRGSSIRGGLKAARELIKAVQEGWHAAITVDGPRGPFKEVKAGPFEIARRSGAPIVPVAVRASHAWTFKRSWDHFRLPLPGARVAIVYGAPMVVPPEYPDSATQMGLRQLLARRLHLLESQASARVGQRHDVPAASLAWMNGAAPGPEVGDA
ncbi:MAG: lysophospholipid acyltransferase family protein [Planctomycetes bacterium]|nr:lysophospholipid acyltransferase family protein [Planctomycetota bacterium]